MLYAFQPLLCLKLCWHNRLKPTCDTSGVNTHVCTVKTDLLFGQVQSCYWIVLNLTTPTLVKTTSMHWYVITKCALVL